MPKFMKRILTVIVVGSILVPQASLAARGWVRDAQVTRLMLTHDKFGNCMALLSKKNDSLSCSPWVVFDCAGDLEGNTKSAGNAKFNSAQLALVTGNKVQAFVNDNMKINGQCFAERVDVYGR